MVYALPFLGIHGDLRGHVYKLNSEHNYKERKQSFIDVCVTKFILDAVQTPQTLNQLYNHLAHHIRSIKDGASLQPIPADRIIQILTREIDKGFILISGCTSDPVPQLQYLATEKQRT